MKKITILAATAFLAITFTSCKKDYTCTCKDKAGKTTFTYPLNKVKKKDANTACDTWNASASLTGGSCSL